MDEERTRSVSAIQVHQWMSSWDAIAWNPTEHRRAPPKSFLQFALAPSLLRRLSGVQRRTTERRNTAQDLGIQRQLEPSRVNEISKFVEFGFPWSDLSEAKRKSPDFHDLRQPGWLPTAVVINILTKQDRRGSQTVHVSDLVRVDTDDATSATLVLPERCHEPHYAPRDLPPFEVIDGQHRLWAFETVPNDSDYQLPVVAFVGLDLSWQAYLFYTINIKPKRINASLAYDLYPLLRTERWLDKLEGHAIYRETRSQELVDKLWSHGESPWHRRINMLGETGHKGLMVTQAAWVRSLLVSFVKSWDGRRVSIGGLFGSKIGQHQTVLDWSLNEQAGFLIFAGTAVQRAIASTDAPWAGALRATKQEDAPDPAFVGQHNLLNQDQGVRILMQVINDLFYVSADDLQLHSWSGQRNASAEADSAISLAVRLFESAPGIRAFMHDLACAISTYDWRASGCPSLTPHEKTHKASFRGSGGYRELRRDLLQHLCGGPPHIAAPAAHVFRQLGFEDVTAG